MGRLTYICATCSEHFTRKYSAKRHNQNLHNGMAEIVRLIDYLVGRGSGQYAADNPFWYKRNNPYQNIGSATVADSIGNALQLSPHTHLGTSPSPIHLPWQVMDDQINQGSLSQEKILKIEELKRLMNKYLKYHTNPDDIIRLAIFNSINGDDTLLDSKLEQLRSIDSLAKY